MLWIRSHIKFAVNSGQLSSMNALQVECQKRHGAELMASPEYNFSDKELHFLVIGILGMMFIFVVYPVFKWLAKHDHVMVIAWIYVFTLIIVITFAIEIGQKVTNTGNMEFADIVFGVVGFIVMFFIFAVIREIYKGIVSLIRDVAHQDQNRSKKRHQRVYDEYEEDVMDEDDEE